MKKLVLLLFVAFISIQISAQEFHFIPRIGFNLANTYPESFADMRSGVNVGVAGEIRFSKLFALEPGVYYSMQGYHYKYNGQTSKLKFEYSPLCKVLFVPWISYVCRPATGDKRESQGT